MRPFGSLLSLLVLAGLTACASAGDASMKNITASEVDSAIHDGVTTGDEVQRRFGAPSEISQENGATIWSYAYTSGREDGLSMAQEAVGLSFIGTRTNNESKSLDVTLRNNIVQSHRFAVKHISGGSGVRQ